MELVLMSFFGANTIVRFSTEWFIAHRFIDFFFFLIIFVWFSFCTSERGAWIEWVILLKGRQKILGGRCVWTCVCVCICNEVCLSLCPLKPLNCSHSYASFFIFFFSGHSEIQKSQEVSLTTSNISGWDTLFQHCIAQMQIEGIKQF